MGAPMGFPDGSRAMWKGGADGRMRSNITISVSKFGTWATIVSIHHPMASTERIANRVLFGGLQKDSVEQIVHDHVTFDGVPEFLNRRNVPVRGTAPKGLLCKIDIFFDESFVDFGVRWKPATVFGWHCVLLVAKGFFRVRSGYVR